MNSAKKARLEGAGWKVGSAAEFLGLSKEEAAFVEMKLALARCLREFRIRRNLSQTRVAALVGSSQSRVAKMESGDPPVSVDLLLRSVLAIGATPRQVARGGGDAAQRRFPSTPHLHVYREVPPEPRHRRPARSAAARVARRLAGRSRLGGVPRPDGAF